MPFGQKTYELRDLKYKKNEGCRATLAAACLVVVDKDCSSENLGKIRNTHGRVCQSNFYKHIRRGLFVEIRNNRFSGHAIVVK